MHQSHLNKGRHNSHKRKESPSRVLLVCVYDTIILEITNDAVFDRFSPFGNIIKILIFERGEVTKFFIEFTQVPEAENVLFDPRRPKALSTGASYTKASAK